MNEVIGTVMLNLQQLTKRLLPVTIAVVSTSVLAVPATAQIQALRNGDDQYIQGLREQGMSELLQRFSETDPPEDPIAKLALDVSLKEFVASDLLARATQASQAQDFGQANQLFQDSRATFEGLLAAQRQLIADHPDDERMPIWQTDFAEMLIDRYLPRYFQNVAWHYEFGQPTEEQKTAFEDSMIEALAATSDAANRLDLLTSRVGADAQLRQKLEEMQIWFKTRDYTSINTPYWFAHAAHSVSLLPDDHAYFSVGNQVRGQKPGAADEKSRLRGKVFDECTSGALASDERTKLTASLLAGRTLVRSSDIDDIDDGVDLLDNNVIQESPTTYHGYLATLAKAYGRYNGGELDITETILEGMGSHQYVQADATVVSRLLAADLLFRILNEVAGKAPADQRGAKIAEAYEKAYIPLIDNDDDPRFKQVLFTRWAESVGDDVDPMSLPATVRMGIGEQLTSMGGGLAQASAATPKPAIPAEVERWQDQIAEAKAMLDRAVLFNTTLTGDEMEAGPLLARGLFNLGTNTYWLAELEKALLEDKNQIGWQPYFAVCKIWLELAVRVPEAAKAEEAISYSIGLLLPMDLALNKESIREPEVRAVYKQAFELINERWPQAQAAHNNRLYAGFHLFEKAGDLDQAAEIYGALPSTHRDYFQSKRQMIYALHRNYRGQSDRLRLMVATKPLDTPPDGLTAKQLEEYNNKKELWQRQHDALVEDITRKRDLIIDEAELVVIDAEDIAENGQNPPLRFAAATALGACRVVLAGMEADAGGTDKAMEMLKGFEKQYSPADGPYAGLAGVQPSPEGAVTTLQGLIQSAQEQRILTLLDAKRTNEMAKQAEVMMQQSPDVAAAVVNGVLQRIRAEIDRERRAIEAAAFERQREQARENIRFFASAAVDLGELLVQWAQGQGFDEKKMTAYQMPLAESLMLAGRGKDALDIMEGVLELYPNNFNILIRHGRAHLAVYKQNKQASHYESSMRSFSKVVKYYNQQPAKPPVFWEAWLGIFELMDAAGGEPAKSIPERARMLIQQVDENFGGPAFKEKFEIIIQRNGGVQRLQPQPGVAPVKDQPEDEGVTSSRYDQLTPWPKTFVDS